LIRKIIFASAIAVLAASPTLAADLVVEDPIDYADTTDAGWYLEFLGGAAFGGILNHNSEGIVDHTHDLSTGYALAAVLGYEVVDNLSIELDGMITSRGIDESEYFLNTASLMAGLRYTLEVTDGFSVYAGAAVGGIWSNDEMWEGRSSGFGYQLKVGAAVEVAERVSLVGELRYQAPFTELLFSDDPDEGNSFGTAAALVGIKFGF